MSAQPILSDVEKDNIIKNVYFDEEQGFRSINETFKQVKERGISLKYLRGWFDKNVEKNKIEGKGFNSFVAPHAKYEYQADLFEITDKQFAGQIYKYGLSVIDIFSKKAAVIPMKTKDEKAWIEGLKEAFEKLGGNPQILMTDQDGALQREFKLFLQQIKTDWIVTRTHAHFVERFNRTFRGLLHKRLVYKIINTRSKKINVKSKPLSQIQWNDHISNNIKTYNNTIHSTTNFKPNEADDIEKTDEVKTNLELKARFNRKYPEVKVGDIVRIVRKKKLGDKEHTGKFLSTLHKVSDIIQNHVKLYIVEGYKFPLLRADIALHKLEVPLFRNRMV